MFAAGAAAREGEGSEHPNPLRLSVVAPCFNEADGLVELHRRLAAACAQVSPDGYEIVLVDDGSNDRDLDRSSPRLARRDPHFVGGAA